MYTENICAAPLVRFTEIDVHYELTLCIPFTPSGNNIKKALLALHPNGFKLISNPLGSDRARNAHWRNVVMMWTLRSHKGNEIYRETGSCVSLHNTNKTDQSTRLKESSRLYHVLFFSAHLAVAYIIVNYHKCSSPEVQYCGT